MDIYQFAMDMETAGREHYLKMAEIIPGESGKRIFQILAEEELRHYHYIRDMSQGSRVMVEGDHVHSAEKTFNDFAFALPLRNCIDYIFTSRDNRITVRKFATLTDSYDLKYPSDHLPVIADILIQKN